MGSISSVYVGTDYRENTETNERNPESTDEENAISLIARDIRNKYQSAQQNHSLSISDDRLVQSSTTGMERMGITTKYLAEENIRLFLENQQLTNTVQQLTGEGNTRTESEDRDAIHGESTEDKLSRLQKILASERQEKWSAIEKSERTRVDLVNCEKEVDKLKETIANLTKELATKQIQCENLRTLQTTSQQTEETSEDLKLERKESLAQFKADLKVKREERQRALSIVSQELKNLKEELKKEKSERQKIERELEMRRRQQPQDSTVERLMSDNATLRNEIEILTENVEKLEHFSTENIKLKCETKRLNEEMDSLNSALGELKFEFYEEKRKHERTLRRLKEKEEERGEDSSGQREWEEEKEKLFEKYDREKEEINKRTNALREVVAITKQMLTIRESEIIELKNKLKDIEDSVKNSRLLEKDGLKAEYEKQLENIKHLKELYEERVRLLETEREKLHETLQERAQKLKDQETEIESLNSQLESSRAETKSEKHEKESLERELRLTIANCKDFENELHLINNLFTQMLLGPYNSGQETDLDKLTELLQENHDLITEMTTREDSSEIASVLPKLLLDLITQVDGVNDRKDLDISEMESCDTISEQSESLLADNQGAVLPILSYKNATLFKTPILEQEEENAEHSAQDKKLNEQINPTVQEIASNLPKVWRVLMELLSHHTVPEEPTPGDEKQCYKNVETPNGPRSVISVSKTFIRLKDLILEKKALQKELTRLKQLNCHLETRLDDQEKRLSQVQCELHKTWGIVGRMRTQHQQLHNHEKILRYELQEKRVMLSELKQELEYCKEKWERARQKNVESETEWKKLRREFAARKSKGYLLSNLNDSGESGFSDEQNESGEDFDADRSSTQSPVDRKLIDELEDPNETDVTVEIMKQSEQNLKQVTENVEHTNLEECRDVATPEVVNVKETNSEVAKAEHNKVEVSTSTTARVQNREEEERARAREARDLRLKRLEEQCKLLVRQVDITTHKSNYLNSRLEELHEQYGSGEEGKREVKTDGVEEVKSCGSGEQEPTASTSTDCEDKENRKKKDDEEDKN